MSDKKPGFFDRLFGRGKAEEKPQPEESIEAVTPDAVTPDAVASEPEPEEELEPGPPETSPEWAELEQSLKSGLADTEDTPEPAETEDHPQESPAPPEATLHPAHDEDEREPEPDILPGEDAADAVNLAGLEDEAEALPEPEPEPIVEEQKRGWFSRLSSGLKRTSDSLTGNISAIFTKRKLDDATLEELEDVLIQADLGIDTATAITEALAKDRYDKEVSTEEVRAVLAGEVEKVLGPVARPLDIAVGAAPFVILMVGVNGSGKTTTIGKLAKKYSAEGKSVMLAAGDTFRAAAIEQLQVWGDRAGVPVVTRPTGSDASGLAFDAVTEAKAAGSDVLIIDTAGRLQNRDELMAELEKIVRVIKKVDATAPHAVLLTLDATTGQNAMSQVEIFGKRAGVTGLVMTKLDGTARGGILVAIAKKHGLPVHFIGVGESAEDLEPFSAADFAAAISGAAG